MRVRRMVIFVDPTGLQYLATADEWYGDGTFSVSPQVFYQLYTVHGEVLGQVLPNAYYLLPDKQATGRTGSHQHCCRETNIWGGAL